MKVAIIMGSNSDWPILEPAEKTLKEFGVEVEVIVASAHRTPDVVHEFAAGARNEKLKNKMERLPDMLGRLSRVWLSKSAY